jgi:putative phosphoribosyl transferase
MFGVTDDVLAAVTEKEEKELARRERAYRGEAAAPDVEGRTVVLVDDGLATGSTMRAAVAALRTQQPARIVVAVPVAAASTCEELRAEVDDLVCASTPEPFQAVGLWYQNFVQTTDEEIRTLLSQAAAEQAAEPQA